MLDAEALLNSPADLERPWLHHLNGDTSWLLQIPRKDNSDRTFFNLLIDPWFVHSRNVQYSAYFHEQHRQIASAVQSVAELEAFLEQTEDVANKLRSASNPHFATDSNSHPNQRADSPFTPSSLTDAIALTLEADDHTHKDTLLEVHPDVPVFALKRSANMVRCWKHFRDVHTIPFYTTGSDWQGSSVPLLPSRISISGLKQVHNLAQLFYGLMVTTDLGSNAACGDGEFGLGEAIQEQSIDWVQQREPEFEAIVYVPHGIHSFDLQHLTTVQPRIRFLALLQGLHIVNFGIPFGGWNFDSNIGAHDALKTQRLLKSKYFIGTHDEVKIEKGFTSLFQSRKALSFQDALEHALERDELETAPIGTDWVELESGESKILLK